MAICKTITNSSGFTMIELMVTIAIAATVMVIGIPNYNSVISKNRLTSFNNEFISSLNFARSEAVKRGVSVSMRKLDTDSSTGTTNSVEWEDGWDIFTDADSDGKFEAGDTLLRTFGTLPNGYTLRGNNNFANFIRFTSRGQSNQNGSFFLCDSNDGNTIPEANTSKLIIVNLVGRVRVGLDTNNDGIPNTDNVASAVSNITTCTPP